MKILIRAPMPEQKVKALESLFSEVVYDPWTRTGEWFSDEKTAGLLQREQPDVFVTELDRMHEKALENCQNVKLIGVCRANPANVSVDLCTQKKIPIICTPGRNAQAVAEAMVGMLICFMRNILPAAEWEKAGKWGNGQTPYLTFKGNEIQGKRIGFVGLGAVGKAAATILQAFGTEICFYDPYVDSCASYQKMELAELFQNCDVVSIHLPVTKDTQKMIGAELLTKMKKNAIFVNTARSAVVDMDALYDVVHCHDIRGAILDVLDQEPPSSELLAKWETENVLLTPHICGASYEVTDHHADIMVRRLQQWPMKAIPVTIPTASMCRGQSRKL
jgi:D-3-phosphoglycerate dehydrogenase